YPDIFILQIFPKGMLVVFTREHPTIEGAGSNPANDAVVAGINEVRTNLIRLNSQPTSVQRRENAQSHRGLAHSTVGTGNDKNGHVIPPRSKSPLDQCYFPRYDPCTKTVAMQSLPPKL